MKLYRDGKNTFRYFDVLKGVLVETIGIYYTAAPLIQKIYMSVRLIYIFHV